MVPNQVDFPRVDPDSCWLQANNEKRPTVVYLSIRNI